MVKDAKKLDIMTPREFSMKAQNRHGKVLEPNSTEEERVYKNASEVLKLIREGTINPSELKPEDRRPVVAYLRLEGHTEDEMAALFNMSVRTIQKDLHFLSKDRVKIMKGLDILEVAGRLVQTAKHLALKSRRAGNYATSWKIEKELIESLQNMGFVYRAPKTLGVASLHASVGEGNLLLQEKVGGEKDLVVDALGSILSSLKTGSRKVRIAKDAREDSEQRSDEVIEISGS